MKIMEKHFGKYRPQRTVAFSSKGTKFEVTDCLQKVSVQNKTYKNLYSVNLDGKLAVNGKWSPNRGDEIYKLNKILN